MVRFLINKILLIGTNQRIEILQYEILQVLFLHQLSIKFNHNTIKKTRNLFLFV